MRVERRTRDLRRCAAAGMTVAANNARVVMKVRARRAVWVFIYQASFACAARVRVLLKLRTRAAMVVSAMSVPCRAFATVTVNTTLLHIIRAFDGDGRLTLRPRLRLCAP